MTLSVFPGVTASVRSTSTNDAFCEMWFVPVCLGVNVITDFIQFYQKIRNFWKFRTLIDPSNFWTILYKIIRKNLIPVVRTFLIYNIGDTFGRFLTSLVQLPAKESTCQARQGLKIQSFFFYLVLSGCSSFCDAYPSFATSWALFWLNASVPN